MGDSRSSRERSIRFNFGMFDLPYLFGAWITDPVEIEKRERIVELPSFPRAWLFSDDMRLVRMDLGPSSDGSGDISVFGMQFEYEIDGFVLVMNQLFGPEADSERVPNRTLRLPWSISINMRLNLVADELVWRYVPATLDEQGFNLDFFEDRIAEAVARGACFIERFDFETAEKIILGTSRKI